MHGRMSKKRVITADTPTATVYACGGGYFALNCPKGIAPTLTTAHHYAGNITQPRQGFKEVGILIEYE